MIRPISLFLLLMLVLANREQVKDDGYDSIGIFFCLFVLPFMSILAVRCKRIIKISPLYATFIILLCLYFAINTFSWPQFLEKHFENMLFLNKLFWLLPTVIWLLVLWWVTSPVKNKLSWVSHRVRLDILLLMIPVYVLLAVTETAVALNVESDVIALVELVTMVLLVAWMPFFITVILSAKQMDNQELQHSIIEVATHSGIRHTKVFVWNTHQQIMNAFATGMAFQPKVLVMTDKLIARLTTKELLAVTAHEYAHHKYLHTTFLVITAIMTIMVLTIIFPMLGADNSSIVSQVAQLVLIILSIIIVLRQFERQADAYSAFEMSGSVKGGVITLEGESTLSNALGAIAFSQNRDPNAFDLVHRSISSRQRYLHGLVGTTHAELAINKRVIRIKISLIITLIITLVVSFIL
jgi:Zn-dependent protease with chaperone function